MQLTSREVDENGKDHIAESDRRHRWRAAFPPSCSIIVLESRRPRAIRASRALRGYGHFEGQARPCADGCARYAAAPAAIRRLHRQPDRYVCRRNPCWFRRTRPHGCLSLSIGAVSWRGPDRHTGWACCRVRARGAGPVGISEARAIGTSRVCLSWGPSMGFQVLHVQHSMPSRSLNRRTLARSRSRQTADLMPPSRPAWVLAGFPMPESPSRSAQR